MVTFIRPLKSVNLSERTSIVTEGVLAGVMLAAGQHVQVLFPEGVCHLDRHQLTVQAADDLVKATDIARAMVARYGMDEDLGHVSYDTDRPGFLGTGDQSSWLNRRYSDATAERMDAKVRDIVDGVFKRTLALLETNRDLLEQSAQDLLQRETLNEPDLVAMGSKVKRTEAVAA